MSMVEDIGTYLESLGIGVQGTSIFLGTLPETPDTAILVRQTGGAQVIRGMGPSLAVPMMEDTTLHIWVRGATYPTGESKTQDVTDALSHYSGVLGTTRYYHVELAYPYTHLGVDENRRHVFSLTFRVKKDRST